MLGGKVSFFLFSWLKMRVEDTLTSIGLLELTRDKENFVIKKLDIEKIVMVRMETLFLASLMPIKYCQLYLRVI